MERRWYETEKVFAFSCLYTSRSAITRDKWTDMMKFIPPDTNEFYDSIPCEEESRRQVARIRKNTEHRVRVTRLFEKKIGHGKGLPGEAHFCLEESLVRVSCRNGIEETEAVLCGAYSRRDCVFGEDQRLEVGSDDIDELVEEHNQDLTTEELMELHCVSPESLSEDVRAKQQSSCAIKEMLNARETVASYIEKHHLNKAVAMRSTNIFYDIAVPHFRQISKPRHKKCL
ncbi:hypothetical protein AVEN_117215-1 [Araneus ventricosus]|uniref:Uncharacterized protein n=1 Tax=Araneus ventricosus TaxID=182803 RepID=A0A4Y2AZ50_ARAVE|nr:hypothetical protein AVEN_117215-1 [Araneus ventricosus]